VREAALARDAALKKVDWKRRDDVNRPPSGIYADADGCGWLQVYGWCVRGLGTKSPDQEN